MRGSRSRLLPLLLFGSLLVHLVLYAGLMELYRDDRPSVIELSLEELVQKPAGREIPRPRFKPKPTPLPQDIVRQSAEPKMVKATRPPAVEPVNSPVTDSLMARIEVPQGDSSPSLVKADVSALPPSGGGGGFGSVGEYYDMVRLKIESNKEYPRQAKVMRREGRVTVAFVIQTGGVISDLVIANSSGNTHLDRAALQAVSESSPLPTPPRRFFPEAQAVKLTIVFELL
ncbi:MAG: energy transducer TonB [Desulfopila sp.]